MSHGERDELNSVMLVIAQPDDETSWGGILGRFRERGIPVSCLCVTRGEGSPMNFVTGRLEDLGQLRSLELREAARRLGIGEVVQLDEPDRPAGESSWNIERIENEIVAMAVRHQPSLILTFMDDHCLVQPKQRLVSRIVRRLAREGRLGHGLMGIYGVLETDWFPEGSFPQYEGSIRFPLGFSSPLLGCSYAEFQLASARAHATQPTAYRGLVDGDEVLTPLLLFEKKVEGLLRDLSAMNAPGAGWAPRRELRVVTEQVER